MGQLKDRRTVRESKRSGDIKGTLAHVMDVRGNQWIPIRRATGYERANGKLRGWRAAFPY